MKKKYVYPWLDRFGQMPSAAKSWTFYRWSSPTSMNVGEELQEPENFTGHTFLDGPSYARGIRMAQSVSLSPCYVRDLAGRVIYTGYGPEFKGEDEWKSVSPRLFPKNCTALLSDEEEVYGIDQAIFTSFRNLDVSLDARARPSGQDGEVFLRYKTPNLFPYKLRLDTFYIDGWKVPQTELLYVKTEGLTLTETESLAADFLNKWDSRGNLTYEQWYEKHDGDNWFGSLFEKGVTVIPTLEAYNGYNKVTLDFELEDFWSGRAVEGLHKVVGMEPSEAPKGTILEVKRPGLAMARRIEPAQVIVSDGSSYKSPHHDDPEAYLPDLRLPHTRCSAIWGACYLPTHPSHFEQPALWGWDNKTGKFMQLSGPLWDPLHYYYKSVDEVVKSYKVAAQLDSDMVSVPEHMKLKFYPIDVMSGYDVIDENVFIARQSEGIKIQSAIRRKPLSEASSTLGYHPLPVELEYELDNWLFPELAPKNRLEEISPSPVISRRIIPVIRSNVSPSYYAKEVEGQAPWISDKDNLKIATGRHLEDYPFLIRYLGDETNLDKIFGWVSLHLEHVSDDAFSKSAYQFWPEDNPETLDKIAPGFYTALMDVRTKGLNIMKLRHSLYRENILLYYAAFWSMTLLDDLIAELQDNERGVQAQIKQANQNVNEQYLLDQSNLKSAELGGALAEDDQF